MAGGPAHLLHRKAIELGLFSVGGAGRARVLMYHGIGEEGCSAVNVRHIAQGSFEHHLQLYRDHFHVVDLERLCSGERHPRKLTIALTFDDGLRNNLTHALPLLGKYDVPATFFITGANPAGLPCLWGELADLAPRVTERPIVIAGERFHLNSKARYANEIDGTLLNDRIKQLGIFAPKRELYDQLGDLLNGALVEFEPFWRLMSDDELQQVARHPLITLGSHGWWHNDMARIPRSDVEDELGRSKAYLEVLAGRPVISIAWPAGSYSSTTIEAAKGIGFRHQFAVDLSHDTDHSAKGILDRYGVYDFPVRDRYLLHLIARGAR